MKYILTKTLTKRSVVFSYDGFTYGCISEEGEAVTLRQNRTPWFEVPKDVLKEALPTIIERKGE